MWVWEPTGALEVIGWFALIFALCILTFGMLQHWGEARIRQGTLNSAVEEAYWDEAVRQLDEERRVNCSCGKADCESSKGAWR
jgi:hypothetical protein